MTMRFLLVHSPFLGPASWAPVATELRGRGFEVAVPDIRGWTSWQDQIRVIEERDVDVIVAHSGAGPLVPAVASHLRGDAASVFVDAETAAFDGTHLSIVTDPAEIADVVIGILGSI